MTFKEAIAEGIPENLPPVKPYDPEVSHAPARNIEKLTREDLVLAVQNALRYFPTEWHDTLAPEFVAELKEHGRIYMYRFRPDYDMYARPITDYPYRSHQAASIMLMIQNNLDKTVAKHPHELITYGGNGAVFQNWAQYRLTMQYLATMTDHQTLVMYSGHPLGRALELWRTSRGTASRQCLPENLAWFSAGGPEAPRIQRVATG